MENIMREGDMEKDRERDRERGNLHSQQKSLKFGISVLKPFPHKAQLLGI